MVGFRTLSPEAHAAVLDHAADLSLSLSDYLRRAVARDLATRSVLAKDRGEGLVKELENVGELVSAAINHRARAWHSKGQHFDKTLISLRAQIRDARPELVGLERSTESLAVVKSRVSGDDPDLQKALDFLSEWG